MASFAPPCQKGTSLAVTFRSRWLESFFFERLFSSCASFVRLNVLASPALMRDPRVSSPKSFISGSASNADRRFRSPVVCVTLEQNLAGDGEDEFSPSRIWAALALKCRIALPAPARRGNSSCLLPSSSPPSLNATISSRGLRTGFFMIFISFAAVRTPLLSLLSSCLGPSSSSAPPVSSSRGSRVGASRCTALL